MENEPNQAPTVTNSGQEMTAGQWAVCGGPADGRACSIPQELKVLQTERVVHNSNSLQRPPDGRDGLFQL